jgi:mitochondrial fission protein ELM1
MALLNRNNLGSPDTILALLDDRAGNNAQVLGVAEKLGLPYEPVELRYNALAKLPNLLLGASLAHLDAASKARIKNHIIPSSAYAKATADRSHHRIIVISAGRREAPVSRWIKRQNPAALLCHILSPEAGFREFDLIALPMHDNPPAAPNILPILTAPSAISPETLSKARAQWESRFAPLKPPRIGVLIGGSSKHARFEAGDYAALAKTLSQAAQETDGSLLITTSRRTDAEGLQILAQALSGHPVIRSSDHLHFYRYGDAGENPYRGILACADALVVTADSISMISEAAAACKPLYLYAPATLAPKFERFQRALFAQGIAKPFALPLSLSPAPANIPDAALQIAQRLKTLLKN